MSGGPRDGEAAERRCAHKYIWPDGNCIRCGVLATLMPGRNTAHIVVPRPKLQKWAWIELAGMNEQEQAEMDVVPCACEDSACRGWQVVGKHRDEPDNPVVTQQRDNKDRCLHVRAKPGGGWYCPTCERMIPAADAPCGGPVL